MVFISSGGILFPRPSLPFSVAYILFLYLIKPTEFLRPDANVVQLVPSRLHFWIVALSLSPSVHTLQLDPIEINIESLKTFIVLVQCDHAGSFTNSCSVSNLAKLFSLFTLITLSSSAM